MRKIGTAFDVPVLSNQVHGGVTPILPPSEVQEMGFAAAIDPTTGLFAASHVLASVYQALAQGKSVTDPLFTFGDFVDVIGFPQVWDFEQNYADLLAEQQI
jgi:2,3-dimethylmalate lyase